MNDTLLMIHWISMFLALAGGVMLAIWFYKNLKGNALLTLMICMIVVGLAGSYLTFETEKEFLSQVFGNKTEGWETMDMRHMEEMMDMMKMMGTPSKPGMVQTPPADVSSVDHDAHHPDTLLSGQGIGPNSIYVADQKPGRSMSVFQVQLEAPGFVVIHKDMSGAFGPIIGSTPLVQAGTTNQIALSLNEAITNGQQLYAMLHRDDGDGKFDAAKDLPVEDQFGNMMHMIFHVSEDATDPAAIL